MVHFPVQVQDVLVGLQVDLSSQRSRLEDTVHVDCVTAVLQLAHLLLVSVVDGDRRFIAYYFTWEPELGGFIAQHVVGVPLQRDHVATAPDIRHRPLKGARAFLLPESSHRQDLGLGFFAQVVHLLWRQGY